MIWGYHYFWKHPYVLPNFLLLWKMIFFFFARDIYCTKDDTNNTEKSLFQLEKKRYSWWFVAPWIRIEGLAGWIYFFGFMCAMVKSRYIGDGHPTFNRNPYNGYINPYYWVDDHPLLYGNTGSLDSGTCDPGAVKRQTQRRFPGLLGASCPWDLGSQELEASVGETSHLAKWNPTNKIRQIWYEFMNFSRVFKVFMSIIVHWFHHWRVFKPHKTCLGFSLLKLIFSHRLSAPTKNGILLAILKEYVL